MSERATRRTVGATGGDQWRVRRTGGRPAVWRAVDRGPAGAGLAGAVDRAAGARVRADAGGGHRPLGQQPGQRPGRLPGRGRAAGHRPGDRLGPGEPADQRDRRPDQQPAAGRQDRRRAAVARPATQAGRRWPPGTWPPSASDITDAISRMVNELVTSPKIAELWNAANAKAHTVVRAGDAGPVQRRTGQAALGQRRPVPGRPGGQAEARVGRSVLGERRSRTSRWCSTSPVRPTCRRSPATTTCSTPWAPGCRGSPCCSCWPRS